MKSFNMNLSKALLIGSVIFMQSLIAQESKPAAAAQMPAPKVDVYIVGEAKDLPVTLTYPARITSVLNITTTARITGILEKKHYTEGTFVHKGDPLYSIESSIYQASVDSAKANFELETAKMEKAKKEWQRAQGLYSDKAISEQDRDTAYFAYETAKASVNVAKAQLHSALINLQYTEVNATISGMTGLKEIDVGDLVKEGTPLVTITQTNPIYAEFSIPDINIKKYDFKNKELKASLTINDKEYAKLGHVDFMDSHINASTGTLKARAVFENPSAELVAGEFATINIIGLVSKNVISVPQKAVLQNPLGTVVFVVVEGKVTVKPVKIMESEGQNFIVEGVKPKDVVIVNNFFRIKPGAAVLIDKTINTQE